MKSNLSTLKETEHHFNVILLIMVAMMVLS